MSTQLTMADLQARLFEAGESPKDNGVLEMIVARPAIGERRAMECAELDLVEGLVGDNWRARGSKHTDDGQAHPEAQITLMNCRVIQLIAQDRSRWPLAGDQLFVDLELSHDNLQPGQRLAIGTAVLEITDLLHSGCEKFTERFGHDAIRFVNSSEGRHLRRRGIYARVVQPGVICPGDRISKIETTS
jgi:MOSC domain-containing protein YiiM